MTFSELGVDSRILEAIHELGYKQAMPVQEEVLPVLLQKRTDIVALAQTGTGKTAAFGIPTIQNLDYSDPSTEALILAPTRELCIQIYNDLKLFSKYIPECSMIPVYGGVSIEMQKQQLKRGVKIVVATPGRMLDLLNRGYVKVDKIKWLILDEADEMLDMGFKDDLDAIVERSNSYKNVLLFSATMPKEVERIARTYMKTPVEIQIGTRNSGTSNVKHFYYTAQAKDRYRTLKRIVDYYPDIYGIVFCRTRNETQEVANMLMKDGYNADALHGDLSQAQRDYVMNRFRCKNLQLLVATDVAARGLDVNSLTHVINYNLPDDIEQYNHRSGRTGRADKTGLSIAIVHQKEKFKIKSIEKAIRQNLVQAKIPSGIEVCEKQLFQMVSKIESVELNHAEIDKFLPVINKKLEWLDKEELIKRVVSLEFNRFLEYYKNAPDLNIEERSERPRQERSEGRFEGQSDVRSGKKARLFINIGARDRIGPQQLIGLINDATQNRKIFIGKIDICDTYSFIEVNEKNVREIMKTVSGYSFQQRKVVVELSSQQTSQSDSRGGRPRPKGRPRM